MISKKITLTALVGLMSLGAVFADRAPEYISPNNDGVKDNLEIPLQIKEKRYIKEWALIIQNADGKVVRTVTNKRKLGDEKMTFKSFWKSLFSPKSGVNVPNVVVWNGFLGEEAAEAGLVPGSIAPDGVYYYMFTATDDNGNTGTSAKYQVIVDNTAPVVALGNLSAQDKSFGEGAKTTLHIEQNGSVEQLWTAVVTDSEGKKIRTYEWKDSAPLTLDWDGADDSGNIVTDGVYAYSVSSTDLAGNVSDPAEIDNIIFSAEKPETNIAVAGSKFFSPNNDGRSDVIGFDVSIPKPKSKVNSLHSWKLSVLGADDGKVYFEQNGDSNPISAFLFDGIGTDKKRLPEGEYVAELKARYINGYEPPVVRTGRFVLNNTAPTATVTPKESVFNGSKPLQIQQKQTNTLPAFTGPKTWVGSIKDLASGLAVKQYKFGQSIPDVLQWDGSTDQGAFAKDGTYVYELSVSDLAGNINSVTSSNFKLDTSSTELRLSVSPEAFSPNGDKVQDTVTFRPVAKASSGIDSYELVVKNLKNEVVRTFKGTNSLPATIVWDGKTDSGSAAPDGRYNVSFSTVAKSGTSAESGISAVDIDTYAPVVEIEVPYEAFSPDGQAPEQSTQQVLPVKVSKASPEKKWTVAVTDKSGKTVKKLDVIEEGTEGVKLGDFTWDGTDDNGNKVTNGDYAITISSTDPAGNSTSKNISNIRVDNRVPSAYVIASESGFSPNGDQFKDSQTFTLRSTLNEGMADWTLDVVDSNGKTVKKWENGQSETLPETITWDGVMMDGNIGQGSYTAKLHVVYKKGNIVDASSKPFICSAEAPVLFVESSANPDIGRYFSPDNDGNEDELDMKLSAKTVASIKNWTLDIKDSRSGQTFWKTSGKSMAGSGDTYSVNINWDGRGNNGESVTSAEDYPYEFTVTDTLGLTNTYKGVIPVDVLVVLDGGRLKMQVPSIVFRSDAADFKLSGEVGPDGKVIAKSSVTPEQKANNERVLRRIAEILKKFGTYKVTIVGHSNPTYTNFTGGEANNPEETTDGSWGRALIPLSVERAEYVKSWLVSEGKVSAGRLSTEGKGGLETIAPRSDAKNRWKNRRVEFILEK